MQEGTRFGSLISFETSILITHLVGQSDLNSRLSSIGLSKAAEATISLNNYCLLGEFLIKLIIACNFSIVIATSCTDCILSCTTKFMLCPKQYIHKALVFSARTLAWRPLCFPDKLAAPSHPCPLIESNGFSRDPTVKYLFTSSLNLEIRRARFQILEVSLSSLCPRMASPCVAHVITQSNTALRPVLFFSISSRLILSILSSMIGLFSST